MTEAALKKAKPDASNAAPQVGKTVRRNIMTLWNDKDKSSELDRLMIAFHRFQTEGRVEYRRLIGMNGGGGGTKSAEFKAILTKKVIADINAHYQGKFPDTAWWPEPVPNAPLPEKLGNPPSPFGYTFCWRSYLKTLKHSTAQTTSRRKSQAASETKIQFDSAHFNRYLTCIYQLKKE